MHEIALLRAEVRELREGNTLLSRNRRKKRTYLQDGGKMTMGEAQVQIDQMDVNTQVIAESSRSGGQGRLVRPGVRRCAVCGKTGHNARTCQEVINISKNEDSR
jgi:hypothetical protein